MERNNGGAVFANRFKDSDKHPDYKGDGVINGVPMQIALWIRKDKNGKDFFSLKFEEKREQSATQQQAGKSFDKMMGGAMQQVEDLYKPSIEKIDDGLPF